MGEGLGSPIGGLYNRIEGIFLSIRRQFSVKNSLTGINISLTGGLTHPDEPNRPMTNTVKDNFSGGNIQNIIDALMAVFYNSLRFHLIYLTILPPEKRGFIWVLTVK